MRRDYLELIRHLAHKHFRQEGLGTDTDFEKLWSEAFLIQEPLDPADETKG